MNQDLNRKSSYKKRISNHKVQQNDEIDSYYTSKVDFSSQKENVENKSEDNFDWDWIFDKGWLRTKK